MSIVNPLMPKSDKLLISSFNISPESSIKATRIGGNDHQLKLLMVKKNPCQYPWKCKVTAWRICILMFELIEG